MERKGRDAAIDCAVPPPRQTENGWQKSLYYPVRAVPQKTSPPHVINTDALAAPLSSRLLRNEYALLALCSAEGICATYHYLLGATPLVVTLWWVIPKGAIDYNPVRSHPDLRYGGIGYSAA